MAKKDIKIVGARTNNLKNISCTIPGGKLTVITGMSGWRWFIGLLTIF